MSPPGADIPNKRYFRIGEVSALTGLEPYVLRYWQTEFPKISPSRSRSGQRLYRRQDIETILDIKHLLYEKRFTIAGAKQHFRARQKQASFVDRDRGDPSVTLKMLRDELMAIKELLSR